ncbi:zinc ABC transporter substrate-binding protein [Parabacteroides sp. PF5-6]|uniref:metal ABC transporter solute-binding protein, Zn/Mn family n=1 Tax=Parabacteroides sp. PF5-6 TaxID=1742403 RepID=UPI002405FACA|nr:zinc ABC transporter substrate-binding protein [Parabacteroides sp. PF5-6]MDF9830562.1 zinc transport system substrate-binding protein [Parabacteroides sp. PF5-6]
MKYIRYAIFLFTFFACQPKPASERIISVTIEPQRYFAEKIGGDKYKINTVVPIGQSPETYDPAPQQMVEIGKSLAYFQIGPIGFELAWMDNIQKNNPTVTFFDLSEGMHFMEESEHHHHAEGEACEYDHGHHHGPQDPHIWSSIHGAKVVAQNMLDAFIALDEAHADQYRRNYDELIKEIDRTEEAILQYLQPALSRAFIIYHPALTYFAEEFNLQQLCIEMDGKEPTPAQLKELVDMARLYNAQVIFVQKEFDQKNAALIAKETGCRLVTINPLAYDWSKEMIHIAKALIDE